MEVELSLLIVTSIVIIGYFFSKVASRLLIRIMQRSRIYSRFENKETIATLIEKAIMLFAVILAIIFLGANISQNLILSIIDMLPKIMMAILIFILGSVIISLIMWFVKKFIFYIRLEDYLSRESRELVFPMVIYFVRGILYLSLLNILFAAIDVPAIKTILDFILYPIIILLFFLIGVGLINPVRDLFAKVYLLNMMQLRPGGNIRINDKEYTIKKIKNLYTEVTNDKNNLIIIPNRAFSTNRIEIERPMKDLDSLNKVKDLFVAQLKSHCGPATMQMVLSVFNYNFDQKELGKVMHTIRRKDPKQKAAGTSPGEMIKAAEYLTNGKVLGAWIDFPKIYDLKDEAVVWLKQGALIVIDIKRKYVFPNSKYAHYSLVVGVRGDELLILDPGPKTGGVYYADYRDILVGMDTYSELIKGKRGYIVLAPKGTEAYLRIKRKQVYYHPSMYDQATKQLRLYLSKISNPTAIKDVMPVFFRRYLRNIGQTNEIRRVWRPSPPEPDPESK